MRAFSIVIIVSLLFEASPLVLHIGPIDGGTETRVAYNNGQGTANQQQALEQTSRTRITNSKLSDGSANGVSNTDKLEIDYESGRIRIDEYLLYKAYRAFDPSDLPAGYALLRTGTQPYAEDGTTVILEIKQNWNALSPETQEKLGFVFLRPTDSRGGPDNKQHLLPKLHNTTNFVIHWTNGTDGGRRTDAVPLDDVNTNGVPDYIEEFGDIFENVRSFEVNNRGFQAPISDAAERNDANRRNPDGRYDVFILEMQDDTLGYTMIEIWPKSPSYSWIAMRNNYSGGSKPQLEIMQVTAAHEFFHAIQDCYDCTEFVNALWWMEATSTYMQDEVYPDVNAHYGYLPDWFECCDLFGLESSDGLHEYGDFIFAKRLSEDFGDGVIRDIWEEMRVTNGTVAIDNVLRRRGSSFVDEFSRFTIANLFLEDKYVDGADYRNVLRQAYSLGYTSYDGVYVEYEYDASLEPDCTVIDNTNVYWKTWMDIWATDYVTISLNPAAERYRIFFDGLDTTTNYLVTMAWKEDGAISSRRFSLDAKKDACVDWPYDPTIENLTLIISNVGDSATADPSWRIVITKLLPQLEFQYDDGVPEKFFYWDTPKRMLAVRFTPSTSGRLTECSFYIGHDPAPVKVHVLDERRIDRISVFSETPMSTGWLHVDLTKFRVPITSGVDFYIAIEWTIGNRPTLGTDLTSDPDGRSWNNNGAIWYQAPLADGDYLIRAIVATETPDLAIASRNLRNRGISWTPVNPIEGTAVTFTVYIRNRGPVNSGAFKVTYYIDGSKIGEWSIPSLSTGQEVAKSFTWAAVQGNHTVKAFADSGNTVNEQVEINNELEKAFQVAPRPKPDLVISSISWMPEIPVEGNPVTFTVTIKNNGTANAASFKTAYYINTTKLGEWSTTSLSVGQELNKTFTWTYVEGSHKVKAIADSNGEIQEDDETNNEGEEIIGNLPPEASFNCNGCNYLSNPIAYLRKSTHFDATESYDPDGSIASFCWDFGDGNKTTVTDPIITHNYTRAGNYTVTLNVTDNLGMLQTASGNVTVKLQCDVNNDGTVNVLDVSLVSIAYKSKPGDPNWNPNVDFDNDQNITILDVTFVARDYGEKA